MPAALDYPISIAPMMDYTDRHCRFLLRLISKKAVLYTEMITSAALLRGDRQRLLAFHPAEHPVVAQLGGSQPKELAYCAQLVEQQGYDGVNLNVGCPSNKVQAGRFGACLMQEPQLVARCISAMNHQVSIPVTIKTRLGVDQQDSYPALKSFIQQTADAGCRCFIIHARKAWLKGLSPKENRTIPPLKYQWVYQVKQDFPTLSIVINGGICHRDQITAHLQQVDGVMLGRQAYKQPLWLAEIEQHLLASQNHCSYQQVLTDYLAYVEQQLSRGVPFRVMVRHLPGLFHGLPGARQIRRCLTSQSTGISEQLLTTINQLTNGQQSLCRE
jgi:tRNA-dihydrouridine synthase A